MKSLDEYLRSLSIESLMELSSISELTTFEENSIVRQVISEYAISQDFYTGLIGLRNNILIEITRRYFEKQLLNQASIKVFGDSEEQKQAISKAREYATLKHFETNHKYDGQPYDVHLKMVYDIACKYIHLLPDNKTICEVLAACWAHDVIEDCRQTYNDVKNVLGISVANIVYALTNEKGKTRNERANDKYYEGIKNTPFATYVKICDRLANVTYSKQNGGTMIKAYKKENYEKN